MEIWEFLLLLLFGSAIFIVVLLVGFQLGLKARQGPKGDTGPMGEPGPPGAVGMSPTMNFHAPKPAPAYPEPMLRDYTKPYRRDERDVVPVHKVEPDGDGD